MPASLPNPALNPMLYGMQTALVNMCSLLNGSMPTTDPYGATYTPSIVVRAVTAEASAQLPEVTVKVEMGRSHFGTGGSRLNDSDDGTIEYRGFRSEGCTFTFTVLARNNAERYAIADSIFALIPAGYSFSSAGQPIEGAIMSELGSNGINVDGWEYVRFPDTDLEDPRYDGQVFSAEMSLNADIWSIWTTQPGGLTQVDITTTVVPYTDPTLPPPTVPAPGGVLPLYTDPTLPVF